MYIKIEKLYKKYGSKEALRGIDLTIEEGMFGLLGPNGAGKTTFMRILCTVLEKSQGNVEVNGISIQKKKQIREITGYLPQEFSFYSSFNVFEAMDYLGVLSGISNKKDRKEKIYDLLKKVNLNHLCKTKVRALSGGMKRRLGIAQALLNDPKVLIVDEPTAGLDPEERIRFRNMLGEFSKGRIVILSTHIVEDIEATCEKLAVLNQGKIVYAGKVADFLEKSKGNVWGVMIDKNSYEEMKKSFKIISAVLHGDLYNVRIVSDTKPFPNAEELKPCMEDSYMKLLGEEEKRCL